MPVATAPKHATSLHSGGPDGNLLRPKIVREVMELTCPKCQGAMRSYERNGVTIDQCAECRGIFLDRGELERLVDAENAWHGAPQQQAPQQQAPQQQAPQYQPAYGQSERREGTYGGQGGYGKHPKKRRKSFLDELFD